MSRAFLVRASSDRSLFGRSRREKSDINFDMFCPKCAAKNEIGQSFCRQCGQSLEIVGLLLKGNVDDAFAKYEKGYDSLIGGLLTFAIFLLIGLGSLIFLKPWVLVTNVILGLIVSLPFVLKGMRQIDAGAKLMDTKNTSNELPPAVPQQALPHTDFMIDPLAPGSVTENTTRELVDREIKG